MVHLTYALMRRVPKADKFWKRRKIFRLSAHFYGRMRNCYRVAIIRVERALVFATKARKLKKKNHIMLWEERLTSACAELDFSYPGLMEGLARSNILLNRKALSELAVWEPRTFKAIVDISKAKCQVDPPKGLANFSSPDGVITRGML